MNRLGLFLCLLFLLAFSSMVQAAPRRYYAPPTQTNAAFQIMDRGFANIMGLFQNAVGSFSFDDETDTISRVKIAIEAESLMTPNKGAMRELHAMFETDEYPEISFMATAPATFKDGRAEIKGTLTVHGQSKPASFEGTLNQIGESPSGGLWSRERETVGLSLRGNFKRSDFMMGDEPEYPGRFGETVTLLLEMQAFRQ